MGETPNGPDGSLGIIWKQQKTKKCEFGAENHYIILHLWFWRCWEDIWCHLTWTKVCRCGFGKFHVAFWFKRAIFSFNPRENHRYHRSKLGLSSWTEEASTSFNSPNGFLMEFHPCWDLLGSEIPLCSVRIRAWKGTLEEGTPARQKTVAICYKSVGSWCWSTHKTDMNLKCWKFGSLVNQVTLQHIIPSGFNAISHTQNEHPSESNATQKGLDLLNYRFTKTSLHLLGWVPIMFRTQIFATACYSYILLI